MDDKDRSIGGSASADAAPVTVRRGRVVSVKAVALGALCLLALGIAGALAFVYSGIFDVTATNPHWDVTYRVMYTVREQAIKRQARDVKVPELDDPQKVHAGFKNYHGMCVVCHGAPGMEAGEMSKGLYPEPPNLARTARNRTAAELYMIIKKGLKMSGMPAWEPSHSGEQIWELVAFLRTLPDIPDDEYQAAVKFYETGGVGLHH